MTFYTNKPYIFDFDKEYEYIGIGQISSETYKQFCVPNRGEEKGKDAAGWSERYKVRLCFLNSKETPEDQLIDAIRQTDFPSGQAGLQMYMPLAADSFVNIHKSRFNRQYYITSLLNNPICKSEKNKKGEDKKGCHPGSGFSAGLAQYAVVPSSNISGSDIANLNGAGADCKFSQSDEDFEKLKANFNVPSACKPFDSNAINNSLKNMKKDIEALRNKLNGPNSTLTNAENFLNEAQSVISGFASKITGLVKWLIGYIKDLVVRGVNWALNKAKAAAFLSHRFQLQDKKTKAIDLILCLFNKILDNLAKLIEQFLTSIVNRYINMATCAVEKFLTELIGQIVGQILAAVNGILNAVLGTISAIKGLIDSVLDAIISLLDFLSCDAKAECAEVTEWSPLEGAPAPGLSLDIGRITSAAKSLISSATSIVDPNNFKFNLDINAMLVGAGDACNVGPILCGPPKISFWGGGGSGATGNAIVSAAGDILGIDLVSTGFGYTKAPFVNIEDSCGRGRGATAVAVVGKVPYVPPPGTDTGTGIDTGGAGGTGTGTGAGTGAGGAGTGAGIGPKPGDLVDGIVDVVVLENGFNYLKKPDGSLGGDGRTWATRCQSKIRRVDETWDYPYNPGEIMNIKAGDYVQLAGENPYISSEETSITAPPCPPEDTVGPTSGVYPVVVELVGAEIVNPGFGYEDGDKIVVTPDNGAVLTPKFGYNGQLIGITVESTGLGYTDVPEIGIDSLNGYNADIKPIFRVVKDASVETLKDKGVGLINVVDCVGKPL
jgi:hypothetical protein